MIWRGFSPGNVNYQLNLFFTYLGRSFVMAACLKNGEILLLRSFDDVIPQVSSFLRKSFLKLSSLFNYIFQNFSVKAIEKKYSCSNNFLLEKKVRANRLYWFLQFFNNFILDFFFLSSIHTNYFCRYYKLAFKITMWIGPIAESCWPSLVNSVKLLWNPITQSDI